MTVLAAENAIGTVFSFIYIAHLSKQASLKSVPSITNNNSYTAKERMEIE